MSAATAIDPKAKTEAIPPAKETPAAPPKDKARVIEEATPEALATFHDEWIARQFPTGKKAAKPASAKPVETDEEKKAREEAEVKVKVEKEAKPAEGAEEKPKEEKVDKPKRKPLAELAPAPESVPKVDEDAIATRAAAKVAQAQAPKVELTPAEQQSLKTFEQMEKSNPRYKGLAKNVQGYWAKETAYIEKWRKDNPGEQFDSDAGDHLEFYKENTPDYEEDDFSLAERAVIKEELKADLSKESKEREAKSDARQRLHQAEPKIAAMRDAAVVDFVRLSQPEDKDAPNYASALGEAKVITPELEAKIEEADPIAKHILVEEGEPMSIMLTELSRITQFPEAYPLNYRAQVQLQHGDRIMYPHAELMSFITELEQKLAARPPEETARDGKRLITNAQFSAETDAISQNPSLSDEQKRQHLQQFFNRYYALSDENFRDAIVGAYASKAKRRIEQMRKLTGRNGSPPKKAGEARQEAKLDAAKPAAEKSKSPSVAASSDNVDTRSPANASAEEKGEFFLNRMFGG